MKTYNAYRSRALTYLNALVANYPDAKLAV